MEKILIIDDDPDIALLLERFLKKKDFEAEKALSGEKGLKMLENKKFELVLCDFRLPDIDGLDMLKKIKKLNPGIAVIIITGYSDVKVAVKAIKYGAYEYVTKPIHPEEILITIKEALKNRLNKGAKKVDQPKSDTPDKPTEKKEKPKTTPGGDYVEGKSPQAENMNKLIALVAPTDISVIIQGESGTGKEIVANTIHKKSNRKNKPFVAIDCGALPGETAGSELFGHVKGAFTGAVNDKTGQFEIADGGTLFMDEIGNLSYENQVKLLRVLQERKIRKIGGNKDIKIDVRIIVASNEDLIEMVNEGKFREDLYHRLNEFKIDVFPLRHRRDDILLFADFFLEKANKELDKNVKGFEKDVREKLKSYYWHGNIRELRNMIKRAVLLTQSDLINANCLPQEIKQNSLGNQDSSFSIGGEVTDLKSVVEKAEKAAILNVLKSTAYNKTKAAKLLDVDRKTLYNKMNAYNIEFKE